MHDARVRHREQRQVLRQRVARRAVAVAHREARDGPQLLQHRRVPPLLAYPHVLHVDEDVLPRRVLPQMRQEPQQRPGTVHPSRLELPALGVPVGVLLGGKQHGDHEDGRLPGVSHPARGVLHAVVDEVSQDVAAADPEDPRLILVDGPEEVLLVELAVGPLLRLLLRDALAVHLRHHRPRFVALRRHGLQVVEGPGQVVHEGLVRTARSRRRAVRGRRGVCVGLPRHPVT
mmetsp:Transcript_101956/g.263505  ORF Transcript_101956/g.263505 Transcript_101956/m.263505 type:complete len:231 (+) Transcript_101956:799-1491(+)